MLYKNLLSKLKMVPLFSHSVYLDFKEIIYLQTNKTYTFIIICGIGVLTILLFLIVINIQLFDKTTDEAIIYN